MSCRCQRVTPSVLAVLTYCVLCAATAYFLVCESYVWRPTNLQQKYEYLTVTVAAYSMQRQQLTRFTRRMFHPRLQLEPHSRGV